MQQNTKDIQNHFQGFLKTPCLWFGDTVFGLKQFQIEQELISFNAAIDTKLRLGKYVERFVSFQLSENKQIEIVSENIQIQKEKITLGELDCILFQDNKALHLEVIYKFYLYDPTVGVDEIAHFIGPNRKDSLQSKLNKLQEKQLPLLYSKECQNYLDTFLLKADAMEQKVYFKAQLFVPFTNKNLQLTQLNSDCIMGCYMTRKEVAQFTACKFYMPNKKDWLTLPHSNVSWQTFTSFIESASKVLNTNFSPMCWIKNPNGILEKFFLVWW